MAASSADPRDSARLLHLALGGAALSVLLSGYAAWDRFRAPPPTPLASSCSCDELRREIESKQMTTPPTNRPVGGAEALVLTQLANRVAKLEQAAQDASSQPNQADSNGTNKPDRGAEAPQYVRFDVPNKSVRVEQVDGGALRVTNSDPALTGQTMIIDGYGQDGSRQPVTITIPAPE